MCRKTFLNSRRLQGLALIGVGALLGSCGAVANDSADQLNPASARISNAAIHADHGTYTVTQLRIKSLNDKGVEIDNYHLSKAQCWLDTSFHEYTRNDRGGYPQAALDESDKLIRALEDGRQPGGDTPLVNGAERLRPDLWARFEALKTKRGFRCAAKATACAEVELVHAGNEIHDGGWRHAAPYIQMAEDMISRAERSEASCVVDAPPALAQTPLPPQVERFDLSADALFKFNRGDLAGLLPQGKARLDELIARLTNDYVQIDTMRLAGHTDRLGALEYNQGLSEQRALTIKQYLQSGGIRSIIEASGRGESQPSGTTGRCLGERATSELTACLQPDRRVSVEIVGARRAHR